MLSQLIPVSEVILYCVILVVNTKFTHVVAGRVIQSGATRVGDQCFIARTALYSVGLNKDINPTGIQSLRFSIHHKT